MAVSGIADTAGFHKTLEAAGINICETIVFLDHHDYVQKDINIILEKAEKDNIDIIVTTEKDLVKLNNYSLRRLMLIIV